MTQKHKPTYISNDDFSNGTKLRGIIPTIRFNYGCYDLLVVSLGADEETIKEATKKTFQACNSHDDLVELVKEFRNWADHEDNTSTVERIDAALSKAKVIK